MASVRMFSNMKIYFFSFFMITFFQIKNVHANSCSTLKVNSNVSVSCSGNSIICHSINHHSKISSESSCKFSFFSKDEARNFFKKEANKLQRENDSLNKKIKALSYQIIAINKQIRKFRSKLKSPKKKLSALKKIKKLKQKRFLVESKIKKYKALYKSNQSLVSYLHYLDFKLDLL